MLMIAMTMMVASGAAGQGNTVPRCVYERKRGPFEIAALADDAASGSVWVTYQIPKRWITSNRAEARQSVPSIHIEYRVPLSRNSYRSLTFRDFRRVLDSAPSELRTFTMACGPAVKLSGTVHRPSMAMNITRQSSIESTHACIAGLKRHGSVRMRFQDSENRQSAVTIEGQAAFGPALAEAERLLKRAHRDAAAGRCRLVSWPVTW